MEQGKSLDQTDINTLAQAFLEELRSYDSNENTFVYGFGRVEPRNPFLFRVSVSPRTDLFHMSYFPQFDKFFPLAPFGMFGLKESPLIPVTLITMYFCAAEQHVDRISATTYECDICGFQGKQQIVIDHMVDMHAEDLSKELKNHEKYLNDDTEFLTGMFTKLQFDLVIKHPKKEYQLTRIRNQCGVNICAPIIEQYDEYDSSDDYNSSDEFADQESYPPIVEDTPTIVNIETHNSTKEEVMQVDQPKNLPSQSVNLAPQLEEKFQVTFNYKFSPPLTKYLSDHITSARNKKYMIRQSVQRLQSMEQCNHANKLLADIFDLYGKKSTTNQQISPAKLLDEFPEEEDQSQKKKQKAKPKPVEPENIPYINSIPESIRDEVMKQIVKDYIAKFVINSCPQIIKPLLSNKRKKHLKRLREEKLIKARNEQEQKLSAMRKRKQEKIEQMSSLMVEPLIKRFLRKEIAHIFIEEEKIYTANQKQNEDIIQKEASNDTPHPVSVSGLSQRQLNRKYLIDAFGGYNLAIDENGEPKIRFRYNGNMIEAILFFATYDDVRKALASSPYHLDYALVTLTLLNNDKVDSVSMYTGQPLFLSPTTKNIEQIYEENGKNCIVRIPMILSQNNC